MARIPISTAKASESDTPEGLVINIPAVKSWFLIFFLGFWLFGWAVGEFSAIRALTGRTPQGGSLCLVLSIAWLGAWTAAGCYFIFWWLWNLAGHEVVSLTPTSLAIRRDILGFGRSRESMTFRA